MVYAFLVLLFLAVYFVGVVMGYKLKDAETSWTKRIADAAIKMLEGKIK